jgi:transposase-like protein
MNQAKFDEIKSSLSEFTHKELNELVMLIHKILNTTPKTLSDSAYLSNGLICPNCDSISCVKNGRVRFKQRFLCKDCSKTFGYNSNFVTNHSKLTTEQWYAYIECMVRDYSIRKSATIVEICVKISFYMRHKILDSLTAFMDRGQVSGNVEMDETFLAMSFKGNHKKSGFVLPIKSRKRGKEVKKRGISNEQVCIATAIDKNDNTIIEMICRGRVSSKKLNELYSGHVAEGSVATTDSLSGYKNLSKNLKLKHKPIPSGKHSNGVFNLARINSLHSKFKTWIRRFNGVSTKFLPNYLKWFKWLESVRDFRDEGKIDKMWGASMGKLVDVRIGTIREREVRFAVG